MKKRLLSILLALALCLSLLPVTALAADPAEQFPGLTPGETYWFDLSGADIPGNKNGSLPDDSLHWVPFTYAGTMNAYVLKSRSANDDTAKGDSANAASSTDPSNPIGYTYDHSLFIADYNVTSKANWNTLNGRNLIFGTAYTSGGVDYTLRAPSAGSNGTASGGTPASNEWDAILDKANQSYQDNTVGYIKNWNGMDSWGQDTQDGPDPDWNRATRGSFTARSWQFDLQLSPSVGFRPVLELPSSDTLGSDGLATVTLDLNGGSIGTVEGHITTGEIHLVTKKGESYTAPSGDGLTRPDGNDGTYFMWQDSSRNLYEPGDTVPANVGRLTAIWEGWTELTKDILDSTYKVYSVGAYFYRLPSGNYYLGEDISVDIGIDIGTYATPANVVLDLNGHELKDVTNNTTGSLIFFRSTSSTNTLTLMDSSSGKTGKVIKSSGTTAKLSTNAKLNANGGTIEGLVELVDNTAVIDNTDPSNVTVFTGWVSLYGGTIKGGIFTGKVGIGGGTISDSAKVTVAFDSDGGSDVAEQKVLRGQKVSEPTAPTKAGYEFAGWYNGDTKYDFTQNVTENITLTAKWESAKAPVITGLENNKTYCDTVEFEVSDNVGVASVTANGVELIPDSYGKYTLEKGKGAVIVVATDNADNETSVTVTVNNGHRGGEATCTSKAICDYCGEKYGEVDSSNHNLEKISAKAATVTETGNKEYWHCLDCGKYFADENGENEIKLDDTVISKLPPEIIEGKGQRVTAGKKKELSFKSNAACSDFIRVELDGKTLDEKNYTVKKGSTVVTLKADYVATLSVGKHTIGIVSVSGTAKTTFTVKAKAVVNDNTNPDTGTTTSPQTGDNSNLTVWFALLAVSAAGVMGVGVYSKRRRSSR